MDINELLERAATIAPIVASYSNEQICTILKATAKEVIARSEDILSENKRDLDRMDPANPKYDRLQLTPERILSIAADMENVSGLESPVGRILSETVRPNGIRIRKVAVPFGVVGVIYEARPNVTLDVFSLCLRTGNVCVLKGGSDAQYTNEALVGVIHRVLNEYGLATEVCTLLPSSREATTLLLNAVGLVDIIIPRGSSSLINFVREHARVPVIETGAGVCHTYLDASGDRDKARAIITNAKTRRVSVCNALDCFLIDAERVNDLPYLCEDLAKSKVTIFADKPAYLSLKGNYPEALLQPATEESYGTEFLDYKMSIRTVATLNEALQHIRRFSSKHSECIVSENPETIAIFEQDVDAACVYSNVSTAFTDGAQFGLGAEIGISTQKLHARGPMGLDALTSYKYLVSGNGQTRK